MQVFEKYYLKCCNAEIENEIMNTGQFESVVLIYLRLFKVNSTFPDSHMLAEVESTVPQSLR